MTSPRLALTVIGDEIGPSLDEMLSFCAENGVTRLDMRTVDGRNLLGMSLAEVAAIAARIDAAKIRVPTFVSPLLKWAAPGKEAAAGKVDFAFDPATCPAEDVLEYGCDVAGVLGAPKMRIFSFLRHNGFRAEDLLPALERLMDLSGMHVTWMRLENEPVCNLGSIAELADFFRKLPDLLAIVLDAKQVQIQALPDIGNSYGMGQPPTAEDIAVLAPITDTLHFKDRRDGRAVPFGEGDIPWAKELERILKGVKVPEVLASIETHCFDNRRDATARSVEGLRRIAREIGVEVV